MELFYFHVHGRRRPLSHADRVRAVLEDGVEVFLEVQRKQ